MDNTGRKIYNTLVQIYADTGVATGTTKPNDPSDPDYIPPVIDLTTCPPPDPEPILVNKIKIEIYNETTQVVVLPFFYVRAESLPDLQQAYYGTKLLSIAPGTSILTSPVDQKDDLSHIQFGVSGLTRKIRTRMIVSYKKESDGGFSTIRQFDFVEQNAVDEANLDTPREAGAGTNILKLRLVESPVISPAPNELPVVEAGPNDSVQLPLTTVNLVGSATDSDGAIVSTLWTLVSLPEGAISDPVITTPTNLTTGVTGLTVIGTYIFKLTATDDKGGIGSDTVSIVVVPVPKDPNGIINIYVDEAMPDLTFFISQITLKPYDGSEAILLLDAETIDKGDGVTIKKALEGVYKMEIDIAGSTVGNKSLRVSWADGSAEYKINLPQAGKYVFEEVVVGKGRDGVIINYQASAVVDPTFTILFAKLITSVPTTERENVLPNGKIEKLVGDITLSFYSEVGLVTLTPFTGRVNYKIQIDDLINILSREAVNYKDVTAESSLILETLQEFKYYDYDLGSPLQEDTAYGYTLDGGQGYLIV